MMDSNQEAHDRTVEKIRADLEREGYTVEIEPRVPELEGRSPDLLAKRGGEVLVIEVKLPGWAGSAESSLASLAAAVHRNPGWKFAIATAGTTSSIVDVLEPEEVRRQIAEARSLTGTAAPLLAWAAFEAALRTVLVRDEHRLPSIGAPTKWLQVAASKGLVSPDEEQRLQRFIANRNRLAHGMRPHDAGGMAGDVDAVLEIASRLIESSESRA